MIQPQELRIGNYLHDRECNLCKVTQLGEDSIYAPAIGEYTTKLPNKPIPLTEEILLKFGLKKIDDNLWQYKNGYLIGFYTKRWFIGKYNFDDMVEMITSFYYAHQLQNLYFALTGEDLTFKK